MTKTIDAGPLSFSMASTRFDMDANMTSAAQGLSDADIEILADYLSGLGAP